MRDVAKHKKLAWIQSLTRNSRFWILTTGIVLSICIAGVIQLLIPNGSLQIIRIEQVYGFIAIILLFLAVLASPLCYAYPNLPLKNAYLHARRALGVTAFYYACLHSILAFTQQLGGLDGIKYYNDEYNWSIFFGFICLVILFIMSATSLDWVIRTVGFKSWKLLHRLVYIAGISVLIHLVLIGSHFEHVSIYSSLTGLAVVWLLWLEWLRIYRRQRHGRKRVKQ